MAMIALPKFVSYSAWQDRFDNVGVKDGRESALEWRPRVKAHPQNDLDLTEFVIETCRCPSRKEASFTLFGKLAGYPEQPLCRYEIQICRHNNPKWFPPPTVMPWVLHKHVYNERAIREGHPWDKCAEPILKKMPRNKLSLQQAMDRLSGIFLTETVVSVESPETNDLFFGRR